MSELLKFQELYLIMKKRNGSNKEVKIWPIIHKKVY